MSIPLIFKTITIRNFMSFGNVECVVDLSDQGTVTITGENIDQGGSNGAGKTTLINALCYVLYNKPFDAITLQRLVNTTNDLKNTKMEVRLEFEKGGCEYEVYRSRGAEYGIQILKDGEDITPGKGAIECDALLVDIIGISYELFTKTVIFSGNSQPFLQLPLFQQRNIIEELFNITMLSEKATVLKENIKQVEVDIKIQEAVCKQQEGAVELHERQVNEANSRIARWEKERTDKIEEIEETLLIVGKIDFDSEKALHSERTTLKERAAALSTKISPKQKDFNLLSKRVAELLKEHDHLTDSKCPYCSQPFADATSKLGEVNQSIESRGSKVLELEGELEVLNKEFAAAKARLAEVESEIEYQELDELLAARDNAHSLLKNCQDLKDANNPHIEVRDNLLKSHKIEVDYLKVDELRKTLAHQQFLLKLLTDKNSFLRRRIINQSIPFLNSRLNKYTSILGLPHIVKFDADMSCTVSEFGRELDFGNLSAGEKKRVSTALTLAFRDVLHHLHANINLMFVDELDGALDQNGIDCIVRVLKEKSRDEQMSIFVISHHPSISGRLDSNLIIRKENGFSSVVLN